MRDRLGPEDFQVIAPPALAAAAAALRSGKGPGDEAARALLARLGWSPEDAADARLERAWLLDAAAAAEAVFFIEAPSAPGLAFAGVLGEVKGAGRGASAAAALTGAVAEFVERRAVCRAALAWPAAGRAPALALGLEARPLRVDEAFDGPREAPGTNGAAADRCRARARLRAALELVERDAVALWWEAGAPARRLGASWLIGADLERIREGARAGRRTHLLALDGCGGVPVAVAVSAAMDGGGVVLGYGAGGIWSRAADRAVQELAQLELAEGLIDLRLAMVGRAGLDASERTKLDRRGMLNRERTDVLGAGLPEAPPPTGGEFDETDAEAALAVIADRVGGLVAFDLDGPGDPLAVARVVAPSLQPLPRRRDVPRLAAALAAHAHRPRGPAPLL